MSGAPTPAFEGLLAAAQRIGREVVAPHAGSVDAEARFPHEAFAAMKEAKLLSAYVPAEFGGGGLRFTELAALCEALGHHCGSTAMIYAMHQIQVACISHHVGDSAYFQGVLREIVERQLLLASATTELGVGGDVRTSKCAVEVEGGQFRVEKKAPVISYGEAADVILVTARRAPDAAPNDQVHVFVRKEQCSLAPMNGWDTLGFRGTCSSGYTLRAEGPAEQILPAPYAEIHGRTMHPYSHGVWSALWLGLATDAFNRAASHVRAEARRTPGTIPPTAQRLAELDTVLYSMRAGVHHANEEYERLLASTPGGSLTTDFNYALRVNNLKITTSRLMVEVVSGALMITGIMGYRNDSPVSLSRHLRDAYGAALMVSNDRILGQSAPMQLMRRGA